MPNRVRYGRVGAALTAAAMAVLAVASPAAAEPATGKVDLGANVIGFQVNVGADWLGAIPTSLIGFELSDGTALGMYCVEFYTNIDEEHDMVERPWDEYPSEDSPFNANRAKINWVLHHGYPATSLEALAAALPTPPTDGIDTFEAIAATQSAVWHFSDGVDLDRDDPTSGDASDDADAADTLAIYDYLTGPANVGIGEEQSPTLEVSPADLSGVAGERIGPFAVKTTGAIDAITADLPDGVRLTDVDGVELTAAAITDGTELYLDVPAGTDAGDAKFELTASATVDTGRLFVGENYDEHPTQSLIVAKAETTKITAGAGGSWTVTPPTTTTTTTTTTTAPPATTTSEAAPAPQPKNTGGLASTGASVFGPILIGLVLVGAGIGSLLFVRHRRRA